MSAKFLVILALAALVCTLIAPSVAAPNKTKKRQLQQHEAQIDRPLNDEVTEAPNAEHEDKESHALNVANTSEKEASNKEQSAATSAKEPSVEEKERAARRVRRGRRGGRRRGGRRGVRRGGRRGRKGRRVSQVRRRAGKRGVRAGKRGPRQRRARKQRLSRRRRAGKLSNKNKTSGSGARTILRVN